MAVAIATFIATKLQPSKTHDLQSFKAGHTGNRLPLYYLALTTTKSVRPFHPGGISKAKVMVELAIKWHFNPFLISSDIFIGLYEELA